MSFENLVTVIERDNAAGLEQLRQAHASNAVVFSNARELGDGPAEPAQPADASKLKAMLDLANTGTASLRSRLDALLKLAQAKMTSANRMKLIGAFAATISGGVTAALTYAGNQPVISLVTAGFAMFGGLTTILADQFVRSPSGLAIGSPEEHGKIIQMRTDIERIALRLARVVVTPLTESELVELLGKLDEQSIQLIRYEGS